MRTFTLILALVFLAAFFGLFLFYPMLDVFTGSLFVNGEFSTRLFTLALRDNILGESMVNSLLIALAATIGTTLVALPLAFFAVRRDFVGKGWLTALVCLPMVMPPFLGAVGMKLIFTRSGPFNILLGKVFWALTWPLAQVGLMDAPWDMPAISWFGAAGFWGVVILQTLHLYPIMYLNVAASLSSVDRTYEEAAHNLGAGGWNVFRRVTFPLMLPGYFAGATIVFIWAFTDLGTPLMLNFPRVVPYQIFDMVGRKDVDLKAYALVMLVLAVTVAAFLAARLLVRGRIRSVAAKTSAAAPVRKASGRGTLLIWCVIGLVTFVALIPHIAVVLNSFTSLKLWNNTVLPKGLTLQNFRGVVADGDAFAGLTNSVMYASLTTLGVAALGLLIAYLLTREERLSSGVGAGLLDTTVMLPLAVPGIVLGFGFLSCFISGPLNPLENPVPLLVISYIVRRIPYMARAAVAGFQHVSRSLEEASINLGASRLLTLRRITAPLLLASLIGGAILTFVFSMFEVSQSLVLVRFEHAYPVANVLNKLVSEQEGGEYRACALGVFCMIVMGAGLIVAGRLLGRRLGEIFRAS